MLHVKHIWTFASRRLCGNLRTVDGSGLIRFQRILPSSEPPPPATPLDSLKRAREATSSLIPFPRVGRSSAVAGAADPRLYFGQKRTGKSSLIPFPRVGKRSSSMLNHYRDDAALNAGGTKE